MKAINLAEQITSAIESQDAEHANDGEYTDITTFTDHGVLSNNVGLVIVAPDGSEFQVTIVKTI